MILFWWMMHGLLEWSAEHRNLQLGWRDFPETSITEEQLKAALNKGACSKDPAREGIWLEFFKVYWDSIKNDVLAVFNQKHSDGRTMEQQNHGIVVCIPKTHIPTTPADYKPIIVLNTDYKILARIIANWLRPTLSDMPNPNQYCGVSKRWRRCGTL